MTQCNIVPSKEEQRTSRNIALAVDSDETKSNASEVEDGKIVPQTSDLESDTDLESDDGACLSHSSTKSVETNRSCTKFLAFILLVLLVGIGLGLGLARHDQQENTHSTSETLVAFDDQESAPLEGRSSINSPPSDPSDQKMNITTPLADDPLPPESESNSESPKLIIGGSGVSNKNESNGTSVPMEDRTQWPELAGMTVDSATSFLKKTYGDRYYIEIIAYDGITTKDIQYNRIRLFLDENGLVTRPPRLG